MKKSILLALMALGVLGTLSLRASVTNSVFNGNELSLTVASTANLQGKFNEDISVGAAYFFTRNFGIEGAVPVYSAQGQTVQSVNADLVARLPLTLNLPVIHKNVGVAPYIGIGADYNWENAAVSYLGKVGVEARVNKGWGVFVEGDYETPQFVKYDKADWGIKGGLRFVF